MTEIAARIQRISRVSTAWIALLIVLAATSGALFVRVLTLRETVLPGTVVAGVEVGGMERGEARAAIAAALEPRLQTPVEVSVGSGRFTVVPGDVLRLDGAATEAAAFEEPRGSILGRAGALVAPFALRHEIAPVLETTPDGRALLFAEVYERTERAVPARVRLRGLEPVVVRGRAGTTVDIPVLAAALEQALVAGGSTVLAPVARLAPGLSTAEAKRAAADARALLASPIAIERRGRVLGALEPARLARMIRFVTAGGAYEVRLDRERLDRALRPLAQPFLREPVDARFHARGKRVRVVPHKPGTTVDAAAIEAAVLAGEKRVPLAFTTVSPEFTTADAYALGIRERVSTFTTDMGESSANRIWNVQLLGRYLDGTILEPGETFSYNEVLGPRTVERGFREGQMIWNGVLVPSIGGGVCQTATTIFNAAFEAGLPITQRTNHSFYISHYPLGRDATVSWGGPELVFRNDLDHAILIKAHGNAKTFTVTFYGTKQGRRVVSTRSEQTNWRQPYLQYAVDPSAPPGSVRQTSGGGPGFDVTVYRKVFEDGKLIRRDKFVSRYTPENPTAIYGPGTTPPGPYFYLPG